MSNLNDFVIENGVLKKYVGQDENVVVPESVLQVGDRAFFGCENILTVELPKNISKIGWAAFRDCKKLIKINLPEKLESINGDAFDQCCNLADINIPESVTVIEYGAFRGCKSIINVKIPDNIKKLDWGTFSGCSSLEEIVLPGGLIEINCCFGSCKKLKEVHIPQSVKIIGDNTFGNCDSLTEITLPYNLESVGKDTFKGCSKELLIHCSGKIFKQFSKETKDNLSVLWMMGEDSFEQEQISAMKKYIGRVGGRLLNFIKGDNIDALTKFLSCIKLNLDVLDDFINIYNDGEHPGMLLTLIGCKNKMKTVSNLDQKTEEEFVL